LNRRLRGARKQRSLQISILLQIRITVNTIADGRRCPSGGFQLAAEQYIGMNRPRPWEKSLSRNSYDIAAANIKAGGKSEAGKIKMAATKSTPCLSKIRRTVGKFKNQDSNLSPKDAKRKASH